MKSNNKIIFDLCGGSGAWSKPYQNNPAYDVRIITLPGSDVRLLRKPQEEVYGILAAPPCTKFSVSGAQYWREDDEFLDALAVVDACLRFIFITKPKFWALENPVGRLVNYLGKPKMYFNPCDYGDPYTKKTCLWGSFNIPVKRPVVPTRYCKQGSWIQKLGGKSERTKMLRSITPSGFAEAFFEANR